MKDLGPLKLAKLLKECEALKDELAETDPLMKRTYDNILKVWSGRNEPTNLDIFLSLKSIKDYLCVVVYEEPKKTIKNYFFLVKILESYFFKEEDEEEDD